MALLRSALHLVRRFFEVMTARPLTPDEQAEIAELLRPAEAAFFWAMVSADQRHSLQGATAVAAVAPDRNDLVRAFLLHDVGKRHSSLGLWGRSIASGLQLVRLPVPKRFNTYLAHGPIGAADLESTGAEQIVVAFARHHHQPAPSGVDAEDWALLARADGE